MQKPGPPKFQIDKEKLREIAATGIRKEAIASELGCSMDTLMERQKEDPEISEIIRQARSSIERTVADRLLTSALLGDVQAGKFILERRCGWRDEKTVNHNVSVNPQAEIEQIEAKLEAAGYSIDELKRIKRRPPVTIQHETVQ